MQGPKKEIVSKKGNFPYLDLVFKTNPYRVDKVVQGYTIPFLGIQALIRLS